MEVSNKNGAQNTGNTRENRKLSCEIVCKILHWRKEVLKQETPEYLKHLYPSKAVR